MEEVVSEVYSADKEDTFTLSTMEINTPVLEVQLENQNNAQTAKEQQKEQDRTSVLKHHPRGSQVGSIRDSKHNYSISRMVGEGGFGVVFRGRSNNSRSPVAIKVEHMGEGRKSHLLTEVSIYKEFQGEKGFPKLMWFGKDDNNRYRYAVLEYLGPSLREIFMHMGKSFSVTTVMKLGMDITGILKTMHEKGYLHRDVNPGNFLVGVGSKNETIYVIDFGLSKCYIDKRTNEQLPFSKTRHWVGTVRYASIACHSGLEQSPKDDLESVGYMLIYFLFGKLPWQHLSRAMRKSKSRSLNEQISNMKKRIKEYLKDELPPSMMRYMTYVRSLKYSDKPDYAKITEMFREGIPAGKEDDRYDWGQNKSLLMSLSSCA